MIKQLVNSYLTYFPEEENRLAPLRDQLKADGESDICYRKTLPGHMTASSFVVAQDTQTLAMVKHRLLGKYLQPGGHLELGESPFQAAQRELFEETGLLADDMCYLPLIVDDMVIPRHIAIYRMPENSAKKEPAHIHYDCQYLFVMPDELAIRIDPEESTTFCWRQLSYVAEDTSMCAMVEKIQTITNM